MFSQQITTFLFRAWRTAGFDNVQSFSPRHELIDEWEELLLSLCSHIYWFLVMTVEKISVDIKLQYLCVFMNCGWEMRSVIKLVTLELSTQWRAWMGGNVSAQARVRELVQIYEDRGNFRPLSQFCCFSYAYLGGCVCVCIYMRVCV